MSNAILGFFSQVIAAGKTFQSNQLGHQILNSKSGALLHNQKSFSVETGWTRQAILWIKVGRIRKVCAVCESAQADAFKVESSSSS